MDKKEKEGFQELYPGRQTYIFDDGIQVTSDFDSGNA